MTAPIIGQVLRFGFLILLWLFVFAAFRVIRTDVFTGRRDSPDGGVRPADPQAEQPPPAPLAAPANRTRRAATGRAGVHGAASHPPRRLTVTEGPLRGTSIGLGERAVTIGRAEDSTLVLTDDYASSRHARLLLRDGQWYAEDLGSTNGTYLGDSKLTGPTAVSVHQPIRIGKTVIELTP